MFVMSHRLQRIRRTFPVLKPNAVISITIRPQSRLFEPLAVIFFHTLDRPNSHACVPEISIPDLRVAPQFCVKFACEPDFPSLQSRHRSSFGFSGACLKRPLSAATSDAGRFCADRLKDGKSVHQAGGDLELGVAAQGAGQQLRLHAIRVGDEDTNCIGSGGGQRTLQTGSRETERGPMPRL